MRTVRKQMVILSCLFIILGAGKIEPARAVELSRVEEEYLAKKGVIVFVSQSHYPPFEFLGPDGDHTGMCIDLARWIATQFGFQVHFTDLSFKQAQEAVLSGRADILTSLFFSEKRDLLFDFTRKMFDVPASIFVAADRPDIKGIHDLHNKIIAMQEGDYAREFLETRRVECAFKKTKNFAEATDMVIAGKADAVIGDEQIVLYHIFSNKLTDKIKKVGEPLYIGQNCMGLKDPNPMLAGIMNKGIELARKNGVIDQINKKWLGTRYPSGPSWLLKFYPYILGLMGSIVLAAALGLVWNLKLRQMVAVRTAELAKSEKTLRTILNESPLGIGLADGRVLGWHNPAMSRMLGYGPDELVGRELDVLFPDHQQKKVFVQKLNRAEGRASPHTPIETQWVRKDGSLFDCQLRLSPLRIDDKLMRIAIVEDITEQKQVERLLRIQRDLGMRLGTAGGLTEALSICLDLALEIGHFDCGGVYLVEPRKGDVELAVHKNLPLDFSGEADYYDATSPQAMIITRGEPIFQSYDELIETIELSPTQKERRRKAGLRSIAIIPIQHKGKVIAALNIASRKSDVIPGFDKYALEAIAAQAAGVLARIAVDQALKASQQNLHSLFQSLDDFLFVLDSSGSIIGQNAIVEKRLGYTVEELSVMNVLDVHPPERRQEAAAIVKDMLEGKTTHCPIPLLTKNGSRISVETKITLGKWDEEDAIFGISRDISERLEAEKARQVSEDRLLTAIDAIDEGFVLFDADDRLEMSNAKYLEIYKESREAMAPGARFEDILRHGVKRGQYPEAVGREEEWLAERLARHHSDASNMEQKLPDGRWLKISERKTRDGSTVGFRVDITDIKRSEEYTRKALKEKETLLREIHHRVKNNMQVVSSLLSLQADTIDDRKVLDAFTEAETRVRSMAFVHEVLHQSDNLSEIRLQAYLDNLVNHLLNVYTSRTGPVHIGIEAGDVILKMEHAVPCGLIVTELVTNSLKYAAPPDAGLEIRVEAGREADNRLLMTIADNGVGLPEDYDPRNAKTLGLNLVTGLITHQLEGVFKIKRERGLCWEIHWPVFQSTREAAWIKVKS